MPYVDVLFPISIGPLTYSLDDELSDKADPGMLVSAPLKNRSAKGIILRRTTTPPPGPIRGLSKIHGVEPVLTQPLLKLLLWMSDYYLAHPGIVLKQTFPQEIFMKTRSRSSGKTDIAVVAPERVPIDPADMFPVIEAAESGRYRTFLVEAPSSNYEYSYAAGLMESGMKNALIILPEIAHAELLYRSLRDIYSERVCILHSLIARGRRSEYVDGIIAGAYDIVVGTRAALFAPLKKTSLIIVLHEHSDSYKLEEGMRYNIRDVAVMRGFLEKSAVVLSSRTPSIDSSFNALSKKYTLIKPAPVPERPRMQIIDMRYEKKVRPNISKTVFERSRSNLGQGKKIMFIVSRRGYSTLLLCRECGHAEVCPACSIPLVMHKNKNILRCHYCGKTRDIPVMCSRCKSTHLDLLGSGTQRVQEDIEKLFGVETLRIDSDTLKKKTDMRELPGIISDGPTKVIIGTKMMTKRMSGHDRFSLAAVLNSDSALNFPDFRAAEKAYMELSSLIDLVEPGGDIMIQTRFPQNPLFRHLRAGDYISFVRNELATRKALLYPPYSKLLAIRVSGDAALADTISSRIRGMGHEIEVLGPTSIKNRKGEEEFSILLKSQDRKVLRTAARDIICQFGDRKDSRIIVDVDPL